MNLTPAELDHVKRHNQRMKALGTGVVITHWEGGKIVKTDIQASFLPDFYVDPEARPGTVRVLESRDS